MTANTPDAAALAAFEAFLEVHGANRSRWPAQQRLQFASLIASSSEARRLLAEAEALDRLIEGIGDDAPPRANDRLASRIMAQALAEASGAKPAAPATPVPTAPTIATADVVPLRRQPRRTRSSWTVGAMMAASLLLGITTGAATMTNLTPESDIASAETSDTSYDPAVIALDSDSYGPLGGDLL